ncbi:MAG: ABC transporter permease, partial [Gemmatimonadaceae bacterium]
MRFLARLRMSLEGVTIALEAMKANRVRAALTILGVAVGVFVVVLISSMVHGINQSVAKQFESAGPTTFFVQRYPIVFEACDDSGDTCKWRSNPSLTFAEADALIR